MKKVSTLLVFAALTSSIFAFGNIELPKSLDDAKAKVAAEQKQAEEAKAKAEADLKAKADAEKAKAEAEKARIQKEALEARDKAEADARAKAEAEKQKLIDQANAIKPVDIALKADKTVVLPGESVSLSAVVKAKNGMEIKDVPLEYFVADAKLQKNVFTATVPGTFVVKAKIVGILESNPVTITVNTPYVAVTAVTVNKPTDEVVEGFTTTIAASVSPDNATNKTISWSSADPKIATVENGVVKALSPGKVTISVVSVDGKKADSVITVTPAKILATAVKLSTSAAVIVPDAVVNLATTVEPANATSKTVTWSSSDEKVATVDANGAIKGIAAGEAVITAKADNATATVKITVSATKAFVNFGNPGFEDKKLTRRPTIYLSASKKETVVIDLSNTGKVADFKTFDPAKYSIKYKAIDAKTGKASKLKDKGQTFTFVAGKRYTIEYISTGLIDTAKIVITELK